jgi:hypothetical protein
MNYQLRRGSEVWGSFSIEELRQRRASGELSGAELVRCEGKTDWHTLDFLLTNGPDAMPPAPARQERKLPAWIWVVIAVATVVLIVGVTGGILLGLRLRKMFTPPVASQNVAATQISPEYENLDAMTAATKPLPNLTNAITASDVTARDREFRQRQYLQAFIENGQHDQPWDADARLYLRSWIAEHFGGEDTNLPPAKELAKKFSKDPTLKDPLLLTVLAMNSPELHEQERIVEQALPAFSQYHYHAYPKFVGLVLLSTATRDHSRLVQLDDELLRTFKEMLTDGGLKSEDQQELGELLLHGWFENFFNRYQAKLCPLAQQAGTNFEWLALVLEGEYEINEAWRARGSGYANNVSSQGWQGFSAHLDTARQKLTRAWQLHPNYPLAPERMITVSLGSSGIAEMRQWFDRVVSVQVDYPSAWHDLRWGLRPRWFGSHEAMLAFGAMAVDSGRFDTDVPRKFYDTVMDMESELKLKPAEHIFGRDDVWPHLQSMYEGYIKECDTCAKGWRSTYAAVAYSAGKYDVSRAQFEAINWQPDKDQYYNWSIDLTLLPEEIAARTGPIGGAITLAEEDRDAWNVSAALAKYRELEKNTKADARTLEFIRHRIAELEQEERLARGEWIELQPRDYKDPNWVYVAGKTKVLPDGALEVESDAYGHLLYSRVRVGPQFEVKGEFEVVRTSTRDYQAGIVMGVPEYRGNYWNSFRIKRNNTEGRVVSFGHGWTTKQTSNPADVHDDRNTFTFVLDHFRGTATLNGTELLQSAAQPTALAVRDSDYRLGLGAYSDMNDYVVRYRNMKVRRLDAGVRAGNSR